VNISSEIGGLLSSKLKKRKKSLNSIEVKEFFSKIKTLKCKEVRNMHFLPLHMYIIRSHYLLSQFVLSIHSHKIMKPTKIMFCVVP